MTLESKVAQTRRGTFNMASRKTRATIAKQTIEIVGRGNYRLPDGTTVSITRAVTAAVAGTIHYAPQNFAEVFDKRDAALADSPRAGTPEFHVSNTTTLAAARQLSAGDTSRSVLCLNFASAKNPGGGFLGGSQAQEESLARATALHACISPKQGYYDTNRACGTCLYTDHMIYSPSVPVFRNDNDELLSTPYVASIITAPAVNAGALRNNEPHHISKISEIMLGRIAKVLSLAVVHGHRQLVLGAWGCGVFKNDPASVADWFHRCLREDNTFRGAFDTVVFAVLDRTRSLEIIGPFERLFAESRAK